MFYTQITAQVETFVSSTIPWSVGEINYKTTNLEREFNFPIIFTCFSHLMLFNLNPNGTVGLLLFT